MKKTILTGILLVLPMASWAADIFDVKPGLWETTSTTEMSGMMGMLSEDQLAKIPPAQREKIEAMMKNRPPQTNVSKVCMTKESLSRALSFGQQNNNCTQKVTSLSSTKQELHVECTGQFKGSGDIVIERVDSEHAKGNFLLKGEGDRPTTIKSSFTTKYLSEDCGDVKPVGEK